MTTLAAAGALAATAPAGHAASLTVARGNSADVAVDAAGTAYVAAVTGESTGAVCVLPRGARACAATGAFAIPLVDTYRGDLTVTVPAPGVVDVVAAGNGTADIPTFLVRSADGGRTFGAPVRIYGDGAAAAALGPDGRYAIAAITVGPLRAGVATTDGATGLLDATVLDARGFVPDVAWDGGDVLAAGSDNTAGNLARLPAGADPAVAANWQLAPSTDLYPQLATGPAGAFVLAQPAGPTGERIVVRRIAGVAAGAPVTVGTDVSATSFDLAQGSGGRLVAAFERTNASSDDEIAVTASADGGATWSSPIAVAPSTTVPEPRVAVAADGSARVANANSVDFDEPVSYAEVPASAFPLRTTSFGPIVVSARARCVSAGRVAVSLRASQDGAVRPLTAVLRRATFAPTRASRVRTARFGATLRPRAGARARIHLTPRSGAARTLTLPVSRGSVCP